MTKFNAFQHDGFEGFASGGYNARNRTCVFTDRVAVTVGNVTVRVYDLEPQNGPLFSISAPSSDWDSRGRLWTAAPSGSKKVKCHSRDGTLLHTSADLTYRPRYIACGAGGACYALCYDSFPFVEMQIVKLAGDFSGTDWTTDFDSVGLHGEFLYGEGRLVISSREDHADDFEVLIFDADDGSLDSTKVGVVRAITPGGFLTTPSGVTSGAINCYDWDGTTRWTLAGSYIVGDSAQSGVCFFRDNSNVKQLAKISAAGAVVARSFERVGAIGSLRVATCKPYFDAEFDLFLGGSVYNATVGGGTLYYPNDGLDHSFRISGGGDDIDGFNYSSGGAGLVRINGHWTNFT